MSQNFHLETRHINKRFGHVQALDTVSLQVAQGEFVCLLGPSGCGKTTLLRMIAGFESPDSGQILLDGQDITRLAPHQRGFGMVFQSLALFPHMTVADNIAYGMKLKGIAPAQRRARVDELLQMVQLPTIANRPVSALSGGQRQRVAIARALAVPPRLFLLDEPLSALDAKLRDDMQVELRQLQQRFGVTTIVVTHDQHEAMMLADRLVVMHEGRVQQCDTPSRVYRQPATAFVAGFLGAANLLAGRTVSSTQVQVLGLPVSLANDLPPDTPFTLALRSEDLQLRDATQPQLSASPPQPVLAARIVLVRDLGAVTELVLDCEGHSVRCRSHDAVWRNAQAGSAVHIVLDSANAHVFAQQ